MQAVLYALAVKFLAFEDLEEAKEEFAMTLLGQMLVKDGIERGIEQGRMDAIRKLALNMRENGEPYEKIARYTSTAVETIKSWEKDNSLKAASRSR